MTPAAFLALVLASSAGEPSTQATELAAEAERLAPFAEHPETRRWLATAARLGPVPERRLLVSFRPKRALTPEEHAALPEEERGAFTEVDVSAEGTYYDTFYGTPLAYLRALDLVATHAGEGFRWQGKRVLDFGYGQIGQLQMLAHLGAACVGIDVDPLLEAIYTPEQRDQPEVANEASPEDPGSIELLTAHWPNTDEGRAAVGEGYDVVLARNLLKRGYVAPTNGSTPWVDLGDADEVLARFHDALVPGGLFVVYSLGGRPAADGGYAPSTDIANPWPDEAWRAAGFDVLAYDVDEDEACREIAHVLGWDAPPDGMDLERDLFGVYSILRRRGE